MLPFEVVFPEVAERELRGVQTVDERGRAASFAFREVYCVEPGCDCRRVTLLAFWMEGERVAASIDYFFETSRKRGEGHAFLDPQKPQSEHSESLLEIFEQLVKDREYREQLHRHYEMWKKVVDDPAHPDQAKLRATLQVEAPRRKRAKRVKPSRGVELVAAKA